MIFFIYVEIWRDIMWNQLRWYGKGPQELWRIQVQSLCVPRRNAIQQRGKWPLTKRHHENDTNLILCVKETVIFSPPNITQGFNPKNGRYLTFNSLLQSERFCCFLKKTGKVIFVVCYFET